MTFLRSTCDPFIIKFSSSSVIDLPSFLFSSSCLIQLLNIFYTLRLPASLLTKFSLSTYIKCLWGLPQNRPPLYDPRSHGPPHSCPTYPPTHSYPPKHTYPPPPPIPTHKHTQCVRYLKKGPNLALLAILKQFQVRKSSLPIY